MPGPAKVALSLRHAMRRWLLCPPAAPDRSKARRMLSAGCRLHRIARKRGGCSVPASFPSSGIAIWERMPGPAKVALSLRHAMRRWLLCPPAAPDRSKARRMLSAGCRLHRIARKRGGCSVPASFPSSGIASGKDARTCQGRAVFAARNAAMAPLSAGSTGSLESEADALCRMPAASDRSKARRMLCAGFLSIIRHCHLGKDARTCQGRAVFAARNAAMAPLSAGSTGSLESEADALCRMPAASDRSKARRMLCAGFLSIIRHCHLGKDARTCQGRAVFAARNAAMAPLSAGSTGSLESEADALCRMPAASDRSKARRMLCAGFLSIIRHCHLGKDARTCQGRAVFAARNAAMAPLSAGCTGSLESEADALCRMPAASDRSKARRMLCAGFLSIIRHCHLGKDARTCQGRAVFAARNAAMAPLSAGSTGSLESEADALCRMPAASDRSKARRALCRLPFHPQALPSGKGCPDLPRSRCLCGTQCGDGSSVCRQHRIARKRGGCSLPDAGCIGSLESEADALCRLPFHPQALPSGKDARTCQGRAVFATRNAAMAPLSAGCTGSLESEADALCRMPAASDRSKARRMLCAGFLSILRHCHLERMPGPAKVALSLRHAMRRWLLCPPAAPDRSKARRMLSAGCRLHRIARKRGGCSVPASFPSSGIAIWERMPGPAKVALSLRHAMRRWLLCPPAAPDRSKARRMLSAGCRLHRIARKRACSVPASFPSSGIAIWERMPGPAKVALSLRHAMRRWLICPPAAPDRSKARRMLSAGCRLHRIARSEAVLCAGFLSILRHCHLERMSGPAKVALSLRHAMRRWLISPPAAPDRSKARRMLSAGCRLHRIARSELLWPASFPSQALPSGKDARTCQGRAVFATRNAAMAHLSAGSTGSLESEADALCRMPAASDRSKARRMSAGFLSILRHCHLERMPGPAKVALSLRHAMRRWLISLPATGSLESEADALCRMPAASDRSKARRMLCRLPFHPRHCHLERMSGPAKVALSLRHAMRRWLISPPAAPDRSKARRMLSAGCAGCI